MKNNNTEAIYRLGLEGVIAAKTQLSRVDGQRGELLIGGFSLETVARQATFEEMLYLLWYGELPRGDVLNQFRQELGSLRPLSTVTLNLLEAIAAKKLPVMDVLRIAVGTADLDIPPQQRQDIHPSSANLNSPRARYHWHLLVLATGVTSSVI